MLCEVVAMETITIAVRTIVGAAVSPGQSDLRIQQHSFSGLFIGFENFIMVYLNLISEF